MYRSSKWYSRRAAITLVVAAAALAACGSSDDKASNGATVTDPAQSAASTTVDVVGGTDAPPTTASGATIGSDSTDSPPATATESTEGDADLDATFVWARQFNPNRLDPHLTLTSTDTEVLFAAYDRLVQLMPDGTLEPMLAESWEFSDDGLSLTMHVRPEVTFHDGTPLDAAAVVTNLDRARLAEVSAVKAELATVSAVTAVDDMTVLIEFGSVNTSILGTLSERSGVMISPTALSAGTNLDEVMVGAGPFRFVSYEPDNAVVLERNDDYWNQDDLPKIARLEYRIITDAAARVNALRTGQIDGAAILPEQIATFEGDDNFNLVEAPILWSRQLLVNIPRAGLEDLRVRQAILHAIDREAMCAELYAGACVVTDQPFPPGYFAYNEDIEDVLYPYDPERARELLAEAGVDGLTLELVLDGPTGQAEAVQAYLGEVGITVNINQLGSDTVNQMFVQKNYDLYCCVFGARPDPLLQMFQRTSANAFFNPGGFTIPEMVDVVTKAFAETDPDARDELLREGSRLVAENVLQFVLFAPNGLWVTDANVTLVPYLSNNLEFRDVEVAAG